MLRCGRSAACPQGINFQASPLNKKGYNALCLLPAFRQSPGPSCSFPSRETLASRTGILSIHTALLHLHTNHALRTPYRGRVFKECGEVQIREGRHRPPLFPLSIHPKMPSSSSTARASTSCRRCHRRKKRCDRTLPQCETCIHAQVECSFLDDDRQVGTYPIA